MSQITDQEVEYWHERVRHQNDNSYLALIEALKPRIYPDGGKWCCIYGEMPLCVAGFGDTPYLAVLDFVNGYYHDKIQQEDKHKELYLKAVNGRKDFREALRQEREKIKDLENQVKELKNKVYGKSE